MQIDDLEHVRATMDKEAEQSGAKKYEDEFSVMDRCKFKYNPVFEIERYLPAVGHRALLAYRGMREGGMEGGMERGRARYCGIRVCTRGCAGGRKR